MICHLKIIFYFVVCLMVAACVWLTVPFRPSKEPKLPNYLITKLESLKDKDSYEINSMVNLFGGLLSVMIYVSLFGCLIMLIDSFKN